MRTIVESSESRSGNYDIQLIRTPTHWAVHIVQAGDDGQKFPTYGAALELYNRLIDKL